MRYESGGFALPQRIAIIPLAVALVAVLGVGAMTARAQDKGSKAPDLPYTTIDHPRFVSVAQASFMRPKDIVLGATDGKTAKAYAASILAQHGVVQDTTADGPIAVTW